MGEEVKTGTYWESEMQCGVRAVILEERWDLEVQLFVPSAEPVIPALWRWRLKDSELKATLGLLGDYHI